MSLSLNQLLPEDKNCSADILLGRFLDYVQSKGLELYPSQEEAILELLEGKNVILNTPTGSGKSLVASALHFISLAKGRRSIYTCPIKALVNEKWMALCREFGAENVGLSTGDATVNRNAPILCCTAEILANIALRYGDKAPVDDVVMDEFHWYSDKERGVAWQIPLLTLPQARFLLMSATLGETAFFEVELTKLNRLPTVTIRSTERPVPLEFLYIEEPLPHTVEKLIAEDKAPIYIVHFTQADAAQSAQDFMSINVCSRDEKNKIAKELEDFKFNTPYGPEMRRWLKHGIGLHHAGLLPKYRVLVEKLAQKGLLKIICGTDTLGVGINIPIRTVLFTRICKYDGEKTGILSARDFHQIAGRAGRKGFDERGWVVVLAPEHVIINKKLEEKAARDGKKVTKQKPPDKNFVSWDKKTFLRLISSPPEKLVSRFNVNHGMLINVLSRGGDCCRAMRDIIAKSHESPRAKKAHFRRAWQLFRALVERNIIEFIPKTEDGTYLRVNVELQEDFSMDQTLSLYLIETINLLDKDSPTYHLDVLTLAESIVEDPEIILRKQLDKLKAQKIAEMKMEGLNYEERMEELEKLEYPKPLRDFIYTTFNDFAARHPWIGQENIRPKSIAREMFENCRTFNDYVQEYELQRVEGLLLRHLSNVYKVMDQTVPVTAKTDLVREIEIYLKTMLRQVDSSLLEEWEKMKGLAQEVAAKTQVSTEEVLRLQESRYEKTSVVENEKDFISMIRNKIFSFLKYWANGDDLRAISLLQGDNEHIAPEEEVEQIEKLKQLREQYIAEHQRLCFTPEARNIKHTYITKNNTNNIWNVQQVLVDPFGYNDWVAEFYVDLEKSRSANDAVVKLIRIGAIGEF